MVVLNEHSEVANFVDVSQFETGESAYECGFFTVYLNQGAGQPPHGAPRLTGEEIDQLADAAYRRFWGANTPNDKQGMSLYQLYLLIQEAGLSYLPIKVDLDLIRAWLDRGYGVILCVKEESVYDDELGKVPYSWKPTGNHIITVSGHTDGDVFLCRDTASIGPAGVRPGPRKYDASKLAINNATAIGYHWLGRPAGDPRQPVIAQLEHSYTIQHGDSLWWIANHHGTTVANLLAHNQRGLDEEAQKYGYSDSRQGNLIFPGYVLQW